MAASGSRIVAETPPVDLVERLEKLFTGGSPNRSADNGIEDRTEAGVLEAASIPFCVWRKLLPRRRLCAGRGR